LIDRIKEIKSLNFARHNAITASELCQIRNEAALSLNSYVTLFAWLFFLTDKKWYKICLSIRNRFPLTQKKQ